MKHIPRLIACIGFTLLLGLVVDARDKKCLSQNPCDQELECTPGHQEAIDCHGVCNPKPPHNHHHHGHHKKKRHSSCVQKMQHIQYVQQEQKQPQAIPLPCEKEKKRLCSQEACNNTIQSLIILNNIRNAEIFEACCTCLIVGHKGNSTHKYVWNLNRCGFLEELVGPAQCITVTRSKICDECFVKVDTSGGATGVTATLWQVGHDGLLLPLIGKGTGFVAERIEFAGAKACNVCFIKAVAHNEGALKSALWLMNTDGSLVELVGPDSGIEAELLDTLVGIKECNICFVKVILKDRKKKFVVLWRVEADGSLTEIVGPHADIKAESVSITSSKNGHAYYITIRIKESGRQNVHVWQIKHNGCLIKQSGMHHQSGKQNQKDAKKKRP